MKVSDGVLAAVTALSIAIGGANIKMASDIEVLKASKADSEEVYKVIGGLDKLNAILDRVDRRLQRIEEGEN